MSSRNISSRPAPSAERKLLGVLREADGEPADPEKMARAELLAEMGGELSKVLPHVLVHLVQRYATPQQPANTNAQPHPQASAAARARGRRAATATVVDAEAEPADDAG